MSLSEVISEAAQALLRGELVAIPTETVYGLAADASNQQAVANIYRTKGRPADHPLIVHVASLEFCLPWFRFDQAAITDKVVNTALRRAERFQMLAHAFWPGPLTLIVPRELTAPEWAGAGQASIGLRIPSHPMALALLTEFHSLGGLGVAAPSANRFGKVSPTSAAHVRSDLGTEAPLILDGGECELGLESTIVDLTGDVPALLRPGSITLDEIAQCLDEVIALGPTQASPQVSGSLPSHYAPQTPLRVLASSALLSTANEWIASGRNDFAVWALPSTLKLIPKNIQVIEAAQLAPDYAVRLYANLRRLDELNVQCVLIEKMPDSSQWAAVNDRIKRASFSK